MSGGFVELEQRNTPEFSETPPDVPPKEPPVPAQRVEALE
jgi:hypothetical protein